MLNFSRHWKILRWEPVCQAWGSPTKLFSVVSTCVQLIRSGIPVIWSFPTTAAKVQPEEGEGSVTRNPFANHLPAFTPVDLEGNTRTYTHTPPHTLTHTYTHPHTLTHTYTHIPYSHIYPHTFTRTCTPHTHSPTPSLSS